MKVIVELTSDLLHYDHVRFVSYNPEDDTSVVRCQPHTGRTHQLRLHLQLIGNPIANDPCYGGELKCSFEV